MSISIDAETISFLNTHIVYINWELSKFKSIVELLSASQSLTTLR